MKTIEAAEAKFGEWYRRADGQIIRCVCDSRDDVPMFATSDYSVVLEVLDAKRELEHLPDCTGFDWVDPSIPPDPGEGHRLIDKSKDRPMLGDEYWNRCKSCWMDCCIKGSHGDHTFLRELHYRRRIEPQYRPFRDASEFMPHWNRPVGVNGLSHIRRVLFANDVSIWLSSNLSVNSYTKCVSWDDLSQYVFADDGTPCGVRIDEASK